jgi:hypothetical protein
VTVWWRNSPVMPRMPSSSAAPDTSATGPATNMGRLSAASDGLPWVPAAVPAATTARTAATAIPAARP